MYLKVVPALAAHTGLCRTEVLQIRIHTMVHNHMDQARASEYSAQTVSAHTLWVHTHMNGTCSVHQYI